MPHLSIERPSWTVDLPRHVEVTLKVKVRR